MHRTLLIFDIDGTLLSTRAGRTAFNAAFERVFGLERLAETIAMAGRTDSAIYREICEQHRIDPQTFGHWKLEFLAALAVCLESDPGVTLPGARALVESCSRTDNMYLAVGTGNVEEGARLKLAVHRLNPFFPTGGFGSDGENRDAVIAAAVDRAARHYSGSFQQVVVIGDTPHDIRCGIANRCLTVGVATGPSSVSDLLACGADLVVPDFSDPESVRDQIIRLCS